jgi:hypothetical protein
MEADWSVELGPELPEIHVPWEGFVDLRLPDLRQSSAELGAVAEAVRSPAIARALTILNGEASPVFTAKSDIWEMAGAEIDPFEFAASQQDARCGIASYIDLVERSPTNVASFGFHEKRAKRLVDQLRELAVPNGRVDLVIRGARIEGMEGYGITLYAAGCGGDSDRASTNWEAVLAAAVLATIGQSATSPRRHFNRASSSIG